MFQYSPGFENKSKQVSLRCNVTFFLLPAVSSEGLKKNGNPRMRGALNPVRGGSKIIAIHRGVYFFSQCKMYMMMLSWI